MKKTALFLLINLFFAQNSYSKTIFQKHDLSLDLTGNINLFLSKSNQQSSFENSYLPDSITQNYLNKNTYFALDSQVFLEAKKQEKNFDYGAILKGEININNSRFNQKPTLDQAHLFFEKSDFGKFEIGNYFAVNQKMKVGPARFARAAGGINGKYLEFVNLPMFTNSNNTNSPSFILLAQSPMAHAGFGKGFSANAQAENNNFFNRNNFRSHKDNGFEGFEDATKINYYTPRIKGLQLAASYTPNNNDQGITQNSVFDLNQIYLKNILSFGANYLHYFDNLTLTISTTAEKGEVENAKQNQALNDLQSYDFAFSLSYFGFEIGASFGSWGKSLQEKTQDTSSYYYTLGLAYKLGPLAASLTSLNSDFQNNKYQAISLGLDYKLKRHLISYFEVTKFTFKSSRALAGIDTVNNAQRQILDNQGFVFLSGILFNF